MIKKLKDILIEAPDFPQFVVESLTSEILEQMWNLYSVGLTSEQARRLIGLNTPTEKKNENPWESNGARS